MWLRPTVLPMLAFASLLLAPPAHSLAAQGAERPPYLDTAQPLGKRVEDLIARLTVEEKISQLMHSAPAIPRLGVPAYNWWNECLHGVARNGIATVFPQAIGMAATWNVDLIRQEADVISTEARAKHHEAVRRGDHTIYTGLTMWSPNINIFRDPRWGRGQETYGEDPYLAGRLGVAFVKGLQGEDPRYLKVVSTPKHFAVHSGPEPLRHTFDAQASTRDLRETYLPAFEAAVREGGAFSVMCAYNRYLGQPACAQETLLGEILRKEWGFTGYVVSDCGAITDIWRGHEYKGTAAEAASVALLRGCDLECGDDYRSLGAALRRGLVEEADLDLALTRLFTARFKLGMFDPPETVAFARIPITANDTAEHRALARRVAQESIVLLKNAGGTLPLRRTLKTVAVIGPNADSRSVLLGNYNGTPSHSVTALAGIRAKLPEARVLHARGAELFDVVATPIPAGLLRPRQGGGAGLSAEYFANPQLAGEPRVERVDALVDFAWEGGEAAPGVPARDFSVRWTGQLVPDRSGPRRIGTTSDDGVRLWIDGRLVVDDWTLHGARTEGRSIDFVAGRAYDVKMEYFQAGGEAVARLAWIEPVSAERLIAEAVDAARAAEAVIMVLGLSPALEGEEMDVMAEGFKGGDRIDIGLPRAQQRLLEAVHATGKPVVLVLMSGSALAVGWAAEHVPAIVQAWYGGEEAGTAIADVLFGDVNPAGRLPVTFYKSVDQLPPFEDYAMAGRTYRYFSGEPLFPFGHGLSFTRFRYGGLKLTCACGHEGGCTKKKCPVEAALRAKMASEHGGAALAVGGLAKPQGGFGADEHVRVTVRVENVGEVAGDEVVQVYVRDVAASVPVPLRSLVAFQRVHLAAGEAREVTLSIAPHQLSVIRDDGRRVVEPGVFQVWVGGKQPGMSGVADADTTEALSGQFQIVGDVTPVEP